MTTPPRAMGYTQARIIHRRSHHTLQGSILNHDGPCGHRKRFTEGFDAAVKWVVGRAEVNEQDLILGVVDDGAEVGAKLGEFAGVELAEKDGELGVIAAAFEVVKDFGASFVAFFAGGDVVGDKIVSSCGHGGWKL